MAHNNKGRVRWLGGSRVGRISYCAMTHNTTLIAGWGGKSGGRTVTVPVSKTMRLKWAMKGFGKGYN